MENSRWDTGKKLNYSRNRAEILVLNWDKIEIAINIWFLSNLIKSEILHIAIVKINQSARTRNQGCFESIKNLQLLNSQYES